jgi:chromosome segregation protein
VPVAEVIRISGPHASTIERVIPKAYVAESFEQAVAFSRETLAVVATLDGDVVRGPHLVSGGAKVESRGILATRREIKELRERIAGERESLARLIEETSGLEIAIARATSAIAALVGEQHREEKEIVGHDAQLARAAEESARLSRKADVIARDRRRAEEERAALEARYAEASSQLGRLMDEHRRADERFTEAQRRLMSARETVDDLSAKAAEARAGHAALVERAAALSVEVVRLEEAARELEERIALRVSEIQQAHARRESLLQAIADSTRTLDGEILLLDGIREELRAADEQAGELRLKVDGHDAVIRDARRALEEIRQHANELDMARATAESDLGHLAQTCFDALQCSLDDVVVAVAEMEQEGEATPDAAAIGADEADSDTDESEAGMGAGAGSGVSGASGELSAAAAESGPATPAPSMTAEQAITALKEKIDRLGPVNMMAIEQFDELETRHAFLTTQRQDLIDSIAQTSEAIRRIDETSTARFNEAFMAIRQNFQGTFATLFGGGRAGLTLVDENDPLESGIDIVASPPGKRLQSVQLLSGGEKALTAIALMFAIFQYKPSPFCVLDEIDAPLDDANVNRFVDMLRGMLDRTQFILITHNRQTMEIANRLYGVTMEEPGVSKLISVQLN